MPATPRETVLCRYHYDPLDRLVDCVPSAEAGIQRFYCKSRLASEIQGTVQRSIFQHDDQLLAQLRREDAEVGITLLATDQQRSVLNVLDATGPHPLAYTAYGHRPAENGLLSLLGFNGERPDPVTGHYLLGNGYRAFNPVLMRFNSPDSWSPFGKGGLNAYAYCAGDPISRKDPTGHNLIPAWFFDLFFDNTYLLMKNPFHGKTHFFKSVMSIEERFGGADKLKLLADANKTHPDAIIVRALPKPAKITPLKELAPGEKIYSYLEKADLHLNNLLDNRNLSNEVLTSEKYSQHLNASEELNWRLDRLASNNEMERTIKYLITLREEGPSLANSSYNIKDWVAVATTIRSTTN
ncbi:RHS repeat-associated core domain-containing protein [Pseudomonas sp. Lb2C1-1]|uniref:RHS repeat-associated core domain-containing protein n=1 Tax=Pseudomonas TaxID=286 RepID=UPI00391894AF